MFSDDPALIREMLYSQNTVLTANSSATEARLVLDPPALCVVGEEFLHDNSMNKENVLQYLNVSVARDLAETWHYF